MESPLSSAVSISSLPSEISDVKQIAPDVALNHANYIVPDINGKSLFEPGDGDMELVVNGTRFETHRYLVKRFKKWGDPSLKLQPGSSMAVNGTASSEDFLRMFRVLYATTLEGPFEFDISTLLSALHIATEYDYPILRNYAIRHLERAELTAIKRIEVARKFNLPSWEKPAYIDLCSRDEAIAEEEADVLGMATFVRVAKIREKEQRRRGREVDMVREEKAIESEDPKVEILNEEASGQLSSGDKQAPKETPPHTGSHDKMDPTGVEPGKETNTEVKPEGGQDQKESTEVKSQPSFEDTLKDGVYPFATKARGGLRILGCSCRYHHPFLSSRGPSPDPCALPPCAAETINNLQNEQLAHTKIIAELRSSLDKLQGTPKSESTRDQEIDLHSLASPSIHEEVLLLLNEIS